MNKRIEGGRLASFNDVINRVACPFCKARAGNECFNSKTKTEQEKPHKSRAALYFKETKSPTIRRAGGKGRKL